MSRATARPLLAGLSLGPALATLLAGCGGIAASPSGSTDGAVAPGFDVGSDGPDPPPSDARPGLGGGSPCDAASQCLSGACTVGVCSAWSRALLVRVDTTSAGADLRQSVSDFPLLVRLDARFPFAEARADGADLRFVDRDGGTLEHEIAWWDRAAAMAEVWVRVPRIAAQSTDNALVMYWGNPAATPVSSGPAVFAEFTCVAHMGPARDGLAEHLDDSSLDDRVVAVQNGSPKGSTVPGIAGMAMAFAGAGTYLTTRVSTGATPVTVSLWLRTTSTTRSGIAGFANDVAVAQALRMDEHGRVGFEVLSGTQSHTVASLTGYHDGAWHLVTVRLSQAGQYLFIDGEPVADDPGNRVMGLSPATWRFATAAPLSVSPAGAEMPDAFVGTLDELRVATAAMSDAWIKLAYATQRPDATAVSFLPLD